MKAGIYLHIPFCKSRCSYCDFATDVYRNAETVERYVNALLKEISNFKFQISDKQSKIQNLESEIETVYFGGGTPSLLSAKQLEKIFDTIYKNFSVDENAEITLEMNPATVSLEKLKNYKSLGVNRASFGVQTFNDRALKILARGHDANDARNTFKLLRKANFQNISFDLIAGLPNQTLKDWEQNLDKALKMNPEHLSLYLLEIHQGTPLAEQIRSNRQPFPDEDLVGEMYELMLEKTSANGYAQYEISNFCQSGFESKHNNKYWLSAPVYGFGVSAHSFDGENRRWANVPDTAKYVELIESGKTAICENNILSEKETTAEFAFLRLRLAEGLNLPDYKQKFGVDLQKKYHEDFARFEEFGLIEFDKDFMRLTKKGFVYSNEVFSVFV